MSTATQINPRLDILEKIVKEPDTNAKVQVMKRERCITKQFHGVGLNAAEDTSILVNMQTLIDVCKQVQEWYGVPQDIAYGILQDLGINYDPAKYGQ